MKGQSRLDQIMDYLKSHNLVTVDQLVSAISASPATWNKPSFTSPFTSPFTAKAHENAFEHAFKPEPRSLSTATRGGF